MPKTRIGAIFAAAYLLIVFLVSTPFLFSVIVNDTESGLHSASGMSVVFTMLLTSPLSWRVVGAVEIYSRASSETTNGLLLVAGLAVSALANAAVIYLFVWAIGRLIRTLK